MDDHVLIWMLKKKWCSNCGPWAYSWKYFWWEQKCLIHNRYIL